MGEIELTEEDLAIINGTSALAAFMGALAAAVLEMEDGPAGEAASRIFRKALRANLRANSSPEAPHPMTEAERQRLHQMFRVFVGFYRHPLWDFAELDPGAIKH